MMKLKKQFAVVAILAGALAAPVWAERSPQILKCSDTGHCKLNQTYGSLFDCVVRRGGKGYVSGDGKPYCTNLPGLPRLSETGGEACWLDPDNRGRGGDGDVCFLPESRRGAFVDADRDCGGDAIRVHPEMIGADEGSDQPSCLPSADAVALEGDSRPDPMIFNPLVCPSRHRLVVRYYSGTPVGLCTPAKEGEMRVNGLPMGLKLWHPNPNYNHVMEAERYCKAGTIPVRAKAVGRQRRGPLEGRCVCPEETHKWVLMGGEVRYCFITHEGRSVPLDRLIEGWSEWERELEQMESAAN